ncbi:MipA/OmpV family protein [Undibacterium sp. Di27W]|uniref:MipA/OmpV family protein n=1 Tax=Undibacterium sp. Di27W TaxID=3413036 RepID=UPI003BF263B0
MKSIIFVSLFCVAHVACAQTPASSSLPDGSSDMYIGLGVLSEPSCEVGGEQTTRIMPNVQMQWSNGVFLRNTNLGVHLSRNDAYEFGPLLSYQRGCSASAARKLAGYGDVDGSFQVGGFFNLRPLNNLRIASKLLLGTGAGKKTTYLNIEGRSYYRIAEHHGLALSSGLTWSRRYYDNANSGFDPNLADGYITNVANSGNGFAASGGETLTWKANKPAPNTNANVRNIYLGAHWNWDLSSSWIITSQVTATHQFDIDQDSLWLGKRNYVTVYSGLAYRF